MTDDKVSSEEKSINQKDTNQDSQMSRNAVVLTNRIDVGEALPLIKGIIFKRGSLCQQQKLQ